MASDPDRRSGKRRVSKRPAQRRLAAARHVPGNVVELHFGPTTYTLAPQEQRPVEISTLGFALSAAEEHDLTSALGVMTGSVLTETPGWKARVDQTIGSYWRDLAVAQAGKRWSGDPLGPRDLEYVPGDVCGLRASGVQGSLGALHKLLSHPGEDLSAGEEFHLPRQVSVAHLLYDAVPYYLPVRATLGVAGSVPPPKDMFEEIRLPFERVALFFGADLELPDTMLGGEDVLFDRVRWYDEQRTAGVDEFLAHLAPPTAFGGPVVQLARGNPVKVAGVVLSAGPDGVGLADTVLWLTVSNNQRGALRRVDLASLSHSAVAPIVANFAAAVAWGDWQPPPLDLDLPDDPLSTAFRDATRSGQFRRREASGAIAQVRVLDVQRMSRKARAEGGGTHASPATHIRRGHSRRQRVGPVDDWHYQKIYVMPVLVNPAGKGSTVIRVYRLPDPRLGD